MWAVEEHIFRQDKAAQEKGILGRDQFGVSQGAQSAFQAEAGTEGKHFSKLGTE